MNESEQVRCFRANDDSKWRWSFFVVGGIAFFCSLIVLRCLLASRSDRDSSVPQINAASSSSQSETFTDVRPIAPINEHIADVKKAETPLKNDPPALREKSFAESLAGCNEAYLKAQRTASRDEFKHIIESLRQLNSKMPDAPEVADAMKLISRCYSAMKDDELAYDSFVAYADYLGEKSRAQGQSAVDNATFGVLQPEADEVYRKPNFPLALKYYELLRTRYPASQAAIAASEKIAGYYFKINNLTAGMAEYSKIISEHPKSNEARLAYTSLYAMKANSGDISGAIALWKDYLTKWPEDEVFVHSNLGTLYFSSRQFGKAKEEMQLVLNAPHNENYAPTAHQILELIDKQVKAKVK